MSVELATQPPVSSLHTNPVSDKAETCHRWPLPHPVGNSCAVASLGKFTLVVLQQRVTSLGFRQFNWLGLLLVVTVVTVVTGRRRRLQGNLKRCQNVRAPRTARSRQIPTVFVSSTRRDAEWVVYTSGGED